MFPNTALSEKRKTVPVLFCLLTLGITFLAFYLDILTRNLIAFDIFYFPSLMMVTWYLGGRAGFLITVLISLLWSLAQGYEGYAADLPTFIADGVIHFVIFFFVFWMTRLVRHRALLLAEQSRELARSNLELEQFAAKAAHDLQSPLATVMGYTELIREKYETLGDKETVDFAGRAVQGVKRMTVFIKALLDYSSVSKPERPPAPVELNKVFKEVLEDLHFTVLEKKAEITAGPLPAVPVHAGLAALLFQNLIVNAMKYCEKEPRVHVSASRHGKEWVLSFKDNGIGIPEEARERIFIMFEKLPTRQKYPGSGIGLATCQKIVERYGGRIWVESKPGEGSAFFFTLPASDVPPRVPGAERGARLSSK